MNIAVIGPEKFAFQDMVCLDLSLSLRGSGIYSLLPEPSEGEDARVTWSDQVQCVLEVQVKGASGTTRLVDLIDYLAHYPNREGRPSLLRRLMDEEPLYATFVLSARCGDELLELVSPSNRAERPRRRSISSALAQSVRDEVGRRARKLLSGSLTPLKRRRAEEQAELAQRPALDFETALEKIALVERETAETIEVRLHAALQKERFESGAIRGILARLTDEIIAAKRSQNDVIPALQRVLERYSPVQLQPLSYVHRDFEDRFLRELRERRCFLLAGPPRTGKSWTALALAARLQTEGVEARVGAHVDEAARYLSDDVDARRVYVLDDPFGSREATEKASAHLGALRQLCGRLRPGRYLIVAQTENVLLQVRGASELSSCRVGEFSWETLTRLTHEEADRIWTPLAQSQGISDTDIARVRDLMLRFAPLREPGALAYLAQTWADLPDSPTDEEVVAQAHRDGVDFARSLSEQHPGARDVLIAAAIGTQPTRAVSADELAFLIHGGSDRPAFAGKFETIEFGGDKEIPEPAYTSAPQLSANSHASLDTLQRRRVLAETSGTYNFTHPYLRGGAQALVMPDIPSDRNRLIEQIERGLACPSPVTSRATSDNLRWMRPAFQDGHAAALFELARAGLRSRFPATRDSCFEFLIRVADQLSHDMRDALPGLAEDMIVSLSRIDIKAGIGFISNSYDWFSDHPSFESITPYLRALDMGEPLAVDMALSKRILQGLEDRPECLTQAAVLRLLRADEAIVRAAAAELWISVPRSNDDSVLEVIAADHTPAMSAALIKSLGRKWATLEVPRRAQLEAVIEDQLESASCASVVYSRLVLFNRAEHFGKNPPWKLFAHLMPKALANVPFSVSLRDGRLNAAIDDALEILAPDELLPVLEIWTQRIIGKVRSRFLDEFELSVIEPVVRLEATSARAHIIERLLGVPDTGLSVVTSATLFREWSHLSEAEQTLVLEKLCADDPDTVWLQAVALTRNCVPVEVSSVLGLQADAFDANVDTLEEALGTELFAACFYLYCGWPQPLWWYGKHHASDRWKRIVVEVAKRAGHPLQPVAFLEVVSHQRNLALEVLEALPSSTMHGIFGLLLELQAGTNAEWKPDLWTALIDRLQATKSVDELAQVINPMLEGILEGLEDIDAWLPEGPLNMAVRRLAINDFRGLHTMRTLETGIEALASHAGGEITNKHLKPFRDQLFEAAIEQLERAPPRLHNTWLFVTRGLQLMEAPDSMLQRAERGREQALQQHQRVRDQHNGWPPEPLLTGWRDASDEGGRADLTAIQA